MTFILRQKTINLRQVTIKLKLTVYILKLPVNQTATDCILELTANGRAKGVNGTKGVKLGQTRLFGQSFSRKGKPQLI